MFAARLLLGEFVTGYEVSGWYAWARQRARPSKSSTSSTRRSKELLTATAAWHFETSPRRCAELDWRHPPRIGVAPWRSSSRRPSSPGGRRRETRFELSRIPNLDSCLSRAPGRV